MVFSFREFESCHKGKTAILHLCFGTEKNRRLGSKKARQNRAFSWETSILSPQYGGSGWTRASLGVRLLRKPPIYRLVVRIHPFLHKNNNQPHCDWLSFGGSGWTRASLGVRLLRKPPIYRLVVRIHPFLHKNNNQPHCDWLSFGGSGWIRTTEVVDNRFTVCPLWPLGNTPTYIFCCTKYWSWWTDLNPRPADYKSAALPTELHQRFERLNIISHTFVFVKINFYFF